jgi:alpha-glucosidase
LINGTIKRHSLPSKFRSQSRALKMLKLFSLFITATVALSADLDWYKTASFYQIYPQTFLDGGGGDREGFGTFRGIQQKIPYFKELGIDCLWLTPVFKSSYNAFGYDITDYEDIDTRYGTKDDFRSLVNAVHANGLKIIVDFVPNHCSSDHEFFRKSSQKNAQYDNWFVWADGKGDAKNDPPSNWQKIGGGLSSAWNRHANRSEFYYAQFNDNMPDLNLREPQVQDYWKQFLRLWLDFGLDGFRIDAISHGIEFVFANGTRPDEDIVAGVESEFSFDYLNHTYTQDQPELFELVYDWRDVLDEYNDSAR